MLLFRSEEHIHRWATVWHQARGANLSLDQVWGLARAWYGWDRRDPAWRRRTPDEVRSLFAELGLLGDFWSLTG